MKDGATAVRRATEALEAISAAVAGPRQSIGSKEAAREFFEWFQTTHQAGDLPGIPSGIEPFDLISGGLRPGELTVVCGKPSRGKSVLMLQMARTRSRPAAPSPSTRSR